MNRFRVAARPKRWNWAASFTSFRHDQGKAPTACATRRRWAIDILIRGVKTEIPVHRKEKGIMKFCSRCGHQLGEANARFCSNCGSPVFGSKSPRVPEPSRSTSISAPSPSGESRSGLIRAISRCSTTKAPFGLRLERVGERQWKVVDTFEISEERARSTVFKNTEIHGHLLKGAYTGCPKCGADTLLVTSCCGGGFACIDDSAKCMTCPWCGSQGEITESPELNWSGGKDN